MLKRALVISGVCALWACAASNPPALYGVDSALDGLYTIDPVTGQHTFIGYLGGPDQVPPSSFEATVTMAIRPFDEAIFVWSNGGYPKGQYVLAVVDPCTGTATEVGPSSPGTIAHALGFAQDGRLFAFAVVPPPGYNSRVFLQIDPISGKTREVARIPGMDASGAAYDPISGNFYATLYGTSPPGTGLAIVNPDNATFTHIGNSGWGGSLAFDPSGNLLGAVFLGSPDAAGVIFDIDPRTAQVSNMRTTGVGPQAIGYSRGRPCPVIPTNGWIAVTGKGHYACALSAAREAYCWGSGLPASTVGTNGLPAKISTKTFAAISGGGNHICAITTSGTTECWGDNSDGQLTAAVGPGGTSAPTPISPAKAFSSLTAGGMHTCGLDAAGIAFCWGNNSSGQLGDGTTTSTSAPVAVAGGLVFSALAAGVRHTCGLTVGGATHCWGDNVQGQLGDGTAGTGMQRATPAPVSGSQRFVSLSSGYLSTCGLTSNGAAYCWGADWGGGLGSMPTQMCGINEACTPVPTPVIGGVVFGSLAVGGSQTCGLTPNGFALCWGSGPDQLGIGPSVPACPFGGYTCTLEPKPVYYGLDFATMMAADGFGCGVRPNGVIYCWGTTSPNLGDGVTRTSDRPVAIANPS